MNKNEFYLGRAHSLTGEIHEFYEMYYIIRKWTRNCDFPAVQRPNTFSPGMGVGGVPKKALVRRLHGAGF